MHVIEAVWGLTLVVAPGRVIRFVQGSDPANEVSVARVLGARHMVQAAAILARPTRTRTILGSAVNGLHAVSMVFMAAVDDSRRRIYGCDAAVAALFCTMELLSPV